VKERGGESGDLEYPEGRVVEINIRSQRGRQKSRGPVFAKLIKGRKQARWEKGKAVSAPCALAGWEKRPVRKRLSNGRRGGRRRKKRVTLGGRGSAHVVVKP